MKHSIASSKLLDHSAGHHVLVVDDEEDLLELVRYNLTKEGYRVSCVATGDEALKVVRRQPPDLIVLDLMLPMIDGLEVCRRLKGDSKTRDIPIIMLTAKSEESDMVAGLERGADDYVTKPFSLAELLARVRARLRASQPAEGDVPQQLELGPIRIDLARLTVQREDGELDLSQRESEMLKLLWRERGKPVTRNRFLDEIWGHESFPTTRTVDQHMARLRQKVEVDVKKPRYLHTVFGVGYRLDT